MLVSLGMGIVTFLLVQGMDGSSTCSPERARIVDFVGTPGLVVLVVGVILGVSRLLSGEAKRTRRGVRAVTLALLSAVALSVLLLAGGVGSYVCGPP